MNRPFYGVATITKSQRCDLHHSNVPGPGSYDLSQGKGNNRIPHWTLKPKIQHGSCFEIVNKNPAPGAYQIVRQEKCSPQKNVLKGDKYRHYTQKNYSLSPINLPSCLNLKAGTTFGNRDQIVLIQTSPGPIYHLDEATQNKRKIKNKKSRKGFGSAPKFANSIQSFQIPGPGSYSSIQENYKPMEKWTFGKSQRKQQTSQNQLGPGQYDCKSATFSHSFKLKGKFNEAKAQIYNTGPGSYDIGDTKSKIGTKFNQNKSGSILCEKSNVENSQLSPFSYSPGRYLEKIDENVGFSLGRKINNKMLSSSMIPGPGSYQLQKPSSEMKNAGGYMGHKIIEKKEHKVDNFYKYNPNQDAVCRETPKFSFPQSGRQCKENSQREGKQYDGKQNIQEERLNKKGAGFTIGTSKRFQQFKKENSPYKEISYQSTIGYMPNYLTNLKQAQKLNHFTKS